ncbi:uncharacterized protein ACA1_383460 [Acanthamoeba castellanii str. Neff]|uniref:Uncharacterized protein n=1 Tax=Acanthamoeba castellanii (strain ATCC 30010 / Neff) TaxID=1257118 RepID=L8GUY7_ACACF|nr:uncharacterized protein ACA1_383460 [Acanthamoeba castellanii str. Neff]ELR16815.1 hypothetical protein ACA1_383460 [Acanthamoeba castellanii str. Neff]
MAEDEGEMDNGGVLMEQEEAQVDEGEERTPFYVLSEEAIALFARSDERRRKEKNRRRKEQARAREEAKKARYARKTGAFVTLSTLARGEAGGASDERLERARLFGTKGLDKVEELEGMLTTIYNRACDLKQPVVWPSMPLRFGS